MKIIQQIIQLQQNLNADNKKFEDQLKTIGKRHKFHCECNTASFTYNIVPLSTSGLVCIGGCGGGLFSQNQQNYTIQKIKIYFDTSVTSVFTRIDLTWFDGSSSSIGLNSDSNTDTMEQEFAKGERITGDIHLGDNGIYTDNGQDNRVGYLKFTTSLGNTFEAGKQYLVHKFPTHDSQLTGLFGGASREIDRLGVFLLKPIKGSKLININFPTLSDKDITTITPIQIEENSNCNPNSDPEKQTLDIAQTGGEVYDFKFDIQYENDNSLINVHGVIPWLVQESNGKWRVTDGPDINTKNRVNSLVQNSKKYPFQLKSLEKSVPQVYVIKAELNDLPFQGDQQIIFNDNTSNLIPIEGYYSGLLYSHLIVNLNIEKVDSC